MERLTERTSEGILVKEDYGENVLKTLYQCYGAETLPHYENCNEGYCAMEKLAEYEDLEDRLDQEFNGCISMKTIIDSFVNYYEQNSKVEQIADALLITNDSARKYREWKKLKEQGLLLELPCKVGDTTYRINKGAKNPIIPMTICKIGILYFKTNDFVLEISCRDDIDSGNTHYFSTDIGKTVFLTQAEAEEALKGDGERK